MSRLTDAIAWSGRGVTLSLFVVFPARGDGTFAGPIGVDPPRGVQTYRLDGVDMRLRGRACYEYDLSFEGAPANLESIVIAWLEAAVEAGAEVCWFAFEGSFHFDHVLTADVASQIFGLGSRHGVELALDDQTRLSAGWPAKILAIKERVGL